MTNLVTVNNIKLELPVKIAKSVVMSIPSSVSPNISKEAIVAKITDAFSSRGGFFNFKEGSDLSIILNGFISEIVSEEDLTREAVSAKMDEIISADTNTARFYAEFISKITPIVAYPINFLRSVIMDYTEKAYADILAHYQTSNRNAYTGGDGVIAISEAGGDSINVFNWGLISDANYRQQIMFSCQQALNVFRNNTITDYDVSDLLKNASAITWKDSIDLSNISESDFDSVLHEVEKSEYWSSSKQFIRQILGHPNFVESNYIQPARRILLGENPRGLLEFVATIDSLQLTINHIQTLEKNIISTNQTLLAAIIERVNIMSKICLYLHGALIGFKEVFIKSDTVIIPCDYNNHFKVVVLKEGLAKYLELVNENNDKPINDIDACKEIYKYPDYVKLIGGTISRLGVSAQSVFTDRATVLDRLAKDKAENINKSTENNRLAMYSAIHDTLHGILIYKSEGWTIRPEIQQEFKLTSLYTSTGYDITELMRIAADNGSRDLQNVREYVSDFFVTLKASPGLSKIHKYIKDALKSNLKDVKPEDMNDATMETTRGLCITIAISLLLADFFREVS